MENNQSIQIGYGKATFPTASITMAGFVVQPVFTRTLASKLLGKQNRTLAIPVSAHPDIDGWLYSDQILAPEGTVFLIQTSMSANGRRVRDGSVFIKTRKTGPSLLIAARVPHDVRCTLRTHNHLVFSGNGDILTVADLEAEGIDLPKNYVSAYMDQEEVEECYAFTILRAGVSMKPVVETHVTESGEKITLRVEKANRRIRIRK